MIFIRMQDVSINEKVDIIISEWMGYMLLHEVLVVIPLLSLKCYLELSSNKFYGTLWSLIVLKFSFCIFQVSGPFDLLYISK